MADTKDIMLINEKSLRDKIYIIRGQQVMLDYDLAEIYGYETKAFNRQVKNNAERFEGEDFMFRLTKDEFDYLRCKNYTSSWGGTRYLPNAFTEQGIYLLMTVLKGDLAVRQSRSLVRLFKSMKDHIMDNPEFVPLRNHYALVEKVEYQAKEIRSVADDVNAIKSNMVLKADLADFITLFSSGIEQEEILILDGETFKADLAYQRIYRQAKKKLMVIDDYISAKTLHHLLHSKATIKLSVISDNKARPPLRLLEYTDFQEENPGRAVTFITTANKVHDRYIILDYGTKEMKVFHCGASSKDAGKKITTITQVKDTSGYDEMIKKLLANPTLLLS